MKLLKRGGGKWVFYLEEEEKTLLFALLERYPVMPPVYQPLSRTARGGEPGTDQRLLEEALAEHRRENRKHLQQLLKSGHRIRTMASGFRLSLSDTEIEWLLQMLNDVRVGSWIALGAPEDDLCDFELNETTVMHAWAMEMAGYFQSGFLAALNHG